MKKVVGYAISFVGLGLMIIGFGVTSFDSSFLDFIGPKYISPIGIGLVIVGAFLASKGKGGKKGKKKKEEEHDEVPIYQDKKIVGYRRH